MLGQLRIAFAAVLLLVAGNAAALGLGQIQVKSQRNQPLLAEIPIISTTPGELEALQARLASPETFRRVGLAAPGAAVADLQFSLASDARGRPVIRVTTLKPVDQAVLSFLIEVDWGQGRLVREYTALIDAPSAASAAVQPAIAAPTLEAPAVVQRAPATAPPALAPLPAPSAPPAANAMPANVVAASTIAPAAPPAPAVAIPLPAAASASAVPASTPAEYGPVKRGESLSRIVGKLGLAADYSLDQAMLALLRANPAAFFGDNMNRLKQGAVLRVPAREALAAVKPEEAALVVREQMRQWRQARRTVTQPQVAMTAASTPAAGPTPAAPPAAKAKTSIASKPAAVSPRRDQARLQIVPPTGPGKATATRTGTSAGGEGSMLQQQLQQKNEDIAAKAAEIGELKERVAELEKLRQDQQALLALKDSELAAAQQRLAAANTQAAAAPVAATPAAPAPAQATTQTAPPAAEPSAAPSMMPWLWGGIALVGIALLAWLFMRRSERPRVAASQRRAFDSEALAASLRAPSDKAAAEASGAGDSDGAAATADPASAPAPSPEVAATPAPAARTETPIWHSGWVQTEPPSPPKSVPPPAQPRFVPLAEPAAPAPPKASIEHRMKLARAFLDIGDDHSAKQLLREILDDVDPAAREEAARMLRELD